MANVEADVTPGSPVGGVGEASGAAPQHLIGGGQINHLAVGTVIWLASELMFFVGLFAAYFALREANAVWPASDVELDVARTLVFTIVLVISSGTMHLAVEEARQGRRENAVAWLFGTIVLGALFIANQGLEYAGFDFGLDSHAYGSIYYLLTGFHGLHVIGGLVLLSVLLWMTVAPGSITPYGDHFRAAGYYWHFVDVVWVVVFLVVYVLQ